MRNLYKIKNGIDIIIKYIKDRPNIIALYIFGSYGTKYQNALSDIDFAVLYNDIPKVSDELTLELEFSKILNTDNIDIIDLNKVQLEFQHKVLYTGDLLYCSDEIKLSDFKEHIFNYYGDYGITMKFFYDDYLKGLTKNAL